MQSLLDRSAIACGAQNIYPCDAGAYTGELSAPMLGDYNCTYVLVGHSERRRLFGESEKFIAEKFHYIKEHAMIPILCVGETLVERNNGLTEQVLAQQLRTVVQNQHNFEHCVVAYEPVWAIGTGLTASPEQAQSVHAFIRSVLASFDANAAQNIPIVYGGSVNGQNAAALFAMPDVDGGLVGASSLHAQQFVDIIKCIAHK